MIALRGGLSLIAVVVCAWFALGVHQADEVNAATAVLGSANRLSDTQARAVSADLDSASTLNPDQHVNVLRAELALARGQHAQARAILGRVIHREPKNLEAYEWFVHSSSDNVQDYYAGQIGVNRLAPGILSRH